MVLISVKTQWLVSSLKPIKIIQSNLALNLDSVQDAPSLQETLY